MAPGEAQARLDEPVTQADAVAWVNDRVDDLYGARVGRIESVFVDSETGVPAWLGVHLGRFGGDHVLAPAQEALAGAHHVWLPYERSVIRAAPKLEFGQPLTRQAELTACEHYALKQRLRQLRRGEPDQLTAVVLEIPEPQRL